MTMASTTFRGLGRTAALAMLVPAAACTTCDLPLRPPTQQMCEAPTEACGRRNTPSFRIDEVALIPDTVRAGERTVRRIVYTYCPSKTGRIARGTLEASILLEQKRLMSDQKPGFAIRPGQQVYDAEIKVPKAARPGIYLLITELRGTASADFKRLQAFEVVR